MDFLGFSSGRIKFFCSIKYLIKDRFIFDQIFYTTKELNEQSKFDFKFNK